MKTYKLYYFIILIIALALSEQVWAKDKTTNKSETDNTLTDFVHDSNEEAKILTLNAEQVEIELSDADNTIEKKKDKKNKKDVIKIDYKFFINFGINLATILLIIFLIYYPENKNRATIFSLILFNVVIFLLTFVLNDIKISMGAAFGLFAVFSMLRYRTAGISLKDMTYLFIFIALGLVGAIGLKVQDLAIINGIIFIFIFVLDGGFIFKREYSQIVVYEKIENIKVENYDILLEDLKERTGLNIHRIAIGKLNYLRDSAQIKVFYYQKNKKVYPYCEEK